MGRSCRSPLAAGRTLTRSVLFAAAVLFVPTGNASDVRLKVSVTVSPVVLITVSGGDVTLKEFGQSEVAVAVPVTWSGKKVLTVRAIASGQPSDLGCPLKARLRTQASGSVTVNGKSLSSIENTILSGPFGFESPLTLSVARSAPEAVLDTPVIMLSCRPK